MNPNIKGVQLRYPIYNIYSKVTYNVTTFFVASEFKMQQSWVFFYDCQISYSPFHKSNDARPELVEYQLLLDMIFFPAEIKANIMPFIVAALCSCLQDEMESLLDAF